MITKYFYIIKEDRVNPIDDTVGRLKPIQGDVVYFSSNSVENAVTEFAAKNPGVAFHVLSTVNVFVAAKPKIIRKVFNDDGELLDS